MFNPTFIIFILLLKILLSHEIGLQGFDDSILYSLNWPGSVPQILPQDNKESNINYDELFIQTETQEKYKCLIPQIVEKEKDVNDKYNGPNPLDLLSDLFSHSPCSYRLEAYWTYELCHGKYIRQYHEEREGKKVNLQEYYLGRWDKISQDKLRETLEEEESKASTYPLRVKKVDGSNLPYIQLNMSSGTLCDLSSKPRVTNVLYVCNVLAKHEIYSFKETSICEYEAIVLSPLLCSHPRYRSYPNTYQVLCSKQNHRPQATGENAINCFPTDKAGTKPKTLLQLEVESVKLRHQNFADDVMSNLLAVLSLDKVLAEAGVPRVRLELLPLNEAEGNDGENKFSSIPTESTSTVDSNAFNNFIAGRDCIQGGSGWWKYEFCYGKSVIQYHIDKDGTKTTVNLGNFLKSSHLKWLAAHPHKRPVVGSHLSYLYAMGSVCEETGQNRQTEVKLKCVENRNSPGAVSLYLLEPKTCQYILGVESHLICQLLRNVDADGLPSNVDGIGFSRADYSTGYRAPTKSVEVKGPSDTKEKKRDIKITVVLAEEGNHVADGDE